MSQSLVIPPAAPAGSAAPRTAGHSVQHHLIAYAVALALPILGFVAFVLWQFAGAERARLERVAIETARSVAISVDRELTGLRAALDVLSLASPLQSGDLAGFYDQAKEVERRQGIISVLRDLSGQQLVNTRRPFGTELPKVNLPGDAKALASQRPEVSDLFQGAVAGEPLFTIVVPVLRGGEAAYLLSLSLETTRLRDIILAEKPLESWTVSIVDANGIIMARSQRHGEFVGRTATRTLLDNTRTGREGTWQGVNAEGQAVSSAFARPALADWRIAVGVRQADLSAPLRRSLWLLAGLGLGVLALSGLLAVAFGRRIAGPIQALATRAAVLGRGGTVAPLSTGLTEVDRVGSELESAALALRDETERLEILNRAGTMLAAELELERLVQTIIDAATRLTGASYGALFERVPAGRAGNEEEVWQLSSLAGAPLEAFTRFGMPRATNLFGHTFRAEGVTRSDDVAADPRYGSHGGMPHGHLPVRSYLAVPVVSRSGEVMGALLFGHPEPARFGEREERLITGFAGQAAIALDNARLFKDAQAELEQRRTAEAALAAARAEAEAQAWERAAILGQLAEGVIVADAKGRIIFVNEAATRLHGVARLDVEPEGYAETYHLLTLDGRPHPFETLPLARAVMKGETVTEERWRIRRPDGTEVLAVGSARPVLAPDGSQVGSVLTLRDDTQREAAERLQQRLNEALVERAAELRESNEEIQRYAYIVSHDLRAPLVNVMGFTSELEAVQEDLRAELKSSPRAETIDRDIAEALGFIKAAITKMEGLIAAILKLSREGRRTLRPEPLEVTPLVQGLADAIRHQTDAAGATITIAPDLPDLVADRLAFEQIFGNLLDNAVKYLDPARPGLIEVSGETRGPRVRYQVRDNGRGIAAKDHARVFELFRRAGTQDQPGEGIGLAHVKAMTRALGGRIELASEPGQGSTFTITLPQRAAAEPGAAAA